MPPRLTLDEHQFPVASSRGAADRARALLVNFEQTAVANPSGAVTYQNLICEIQHHTLEPPDSSGGFASGKWTRAEVIALLNQRRRQFIRDTFLAMEIATVPTAAGQIRHGLPDDWIATRRAAWAPSTLGGAYVEVPKGSGWEADHDSTTRTWPTTTAARPALYLDTEDETGEFRLAPAPAQAGTLELLYGAVSALVDGDAGVYPSDLVPSLWLRADVLAQTLAGDSPLAAWPDSSEEAQVSFTQPIVTAQPKLILNAVGGRPAVRFDGVDDRFSSGPLVSATLGAQGVGTIFIVFKIDPAAVATDTMLSADGATLALRSDTTQLQASNDDGTHDTALKAAPRGVWHIGLWLHNTTFVYAGVDDLDTAALTATASGPTTAAVLAQVWTLGGSSNILRGDVAEVLVFPRFLEEDDRRRVGAYLAAKYSISVNGATPPAWSSLAATLEIPDEFAPGIKYGVMADMFGKRGEGADPQRAAYCESRYQEAVAAANLLWLS